MSRGTMVGFWPMLPLGATSGPVALEQLESVTTKDQADSPGLGLPGDMLVSEDCAELAPPLVCYHGRAGPRATRAGELIPPLASCSTPESSPAHCRSCL